MPELPEVETIRIDLNKELSGKEVTGIQSDWPKQVKPSLEEVNNQLLGRSVRTVTRVAKLLSIDFDGGVHLLIHLRLTGQLLWRVNTARMDHYVRHTIFFGEDELRFADARKFGYLQVVDSATRKKVVDKFGPELLEDKITPPHLLEVFSS
jgi:formamidopyrimidine-DNA glycosylase